jgi:hypothetical protein
MLKQKISSLFALLKPYLPRFLLSLIIAYALFYFFPELFSSFTVHAITSDNLSENISAASSRNVSEEHFYYEIPEPPVLERPVDG